MASFNGVRLDYRRPNRRRAAPVTGGRRRQRLPSDLAEPGLEMHGYKPLKLVGSELHELVSTEAAVEAASNVALALAGDLVVAWQEDVCRWVKRAYEEGRGDALGREQLIRTLKGRVEMLEGERSLLTGLLGEAMTTGTALLNEKDELLIASLKAVRQLARERNELREAVNHLLARTKTPYIRDPRG